MQQKSSLADDITVVGGNGTGIFVSHVRHGSVAEQCGLKEGSELLEVCVTYICAHTLKKNKNKNKSENSALPLQEVYLLYTF